MQQPRNKLPNITAIVLFMHTLGSVLSFMVILIGIVVVVVTRIVVVMGTLSLSFSVVVLIQSFVSLVLFMGIKLRNLPLQ